MSAWLISHFAPFDGGKTNSSAIVCTHLKAGDHVLTKALPVSYKSCWKELESYLKSGDFKGVLALGQAEGRTKISLERVALNWIDSRVPDNDGVQPIDVKINPNGADLWTDF